MASGQVAGHDDNFLWLFLLVIALGAHYLSLSGSPEEDCQALLTLSEQLFSEIEYRFLSIIGRPNVEAVQACILLGSFHLFNGRPAVGMGILGSGIKIAQVIGLHRESMWHNVSEVAQETRRRSWWALEVFDKYAFHAGCLLINFLTNFLAALDMQQWHLGVRAVSTTPIAILG